MRACAGRFRRNTQNWGLVGLLQGFDDERYPEVENHPFRGAEWLREQGYAQELVEGVPAHAEHTRQQRDRLQKKAVYAVDELARHMVAAALMRPSKKLEDVTLESVMKKWPEQRFAAGVDRSQVEQGAAELGVPLQQHVSIVLEAMQVDADRPGL